MSTSERPGLIQLTPAAPAAGCTLLGQRPPLDPDPRAHLERQAKPLAWVGNGSTMQVDLLENAKSCEPEGPQDLTGRL
jgi:hypothetical protein